MKRLLYAILALGSALVIWLLLSSSAPDSVDFNAEVRPILNDRCMRCHGGVRKKSGLSFHFRDEALKPADSGLPAIVPGHPNRSELMRRVTHHDPDERMPPEGAPLDPAEVDVLSRWIKEGAPWRAHWAYVKPDSSIQPPISEDEWSRNGIDAFVLARLQQEGLEPSPEADRSTLLRRLSLDLIGLPPTLEEAEAFIQDPSHDAYEKRVDALLASPHFGERWASMWLDLARYGDSQGYQKDLLRPTIWRYRDWVIDAFNVDMPFDQFTIEQLAGDLLPDPTDTQLLATAFHRNTMSNDEGGTDDEEFRVAAVIDRVNTTFEVWQGTTMSCVQCHAHPYDPFQHKEFYHAYAFFNNTADADRTDEKPTRVLLSPAQQREKDRISARLARATSEQERDALNVHLASLTPAPVPIMEELPSDSSRTTHLFERGNWLVHGEMVMPDVPEVLSEMPAGAPPNRLGFAQWLMHPDNPLTARVIVNRYWAQLFGEGLVETVEDFGTQGASPTHPRLLDWMAVEFMHTHQWSLKGLLKEIVMSATYRQASGVSPELLERDPHNQLLARGPRVRLSAEQVRDQALAVSGLLSDKMHGPSVMPPQPEGTWNIIRHAARWETSEGEDRYRRALYTMWRRSSPYPSMVTFDSPSSEFCVSRRIATNTPLQALVTLNDPVYVEAAEALARRMYEEAPATPLDQVRHGYQLVLFKEPSSTQMEDLLAFYENALAYYQQGQEDIASLIAEETEQTAERAALVNVANVLLNLDAVIMKD